MGVFVWGLATGLDSLEVELRLEQLIQAADIKLPAAKTEGEGESEAEAKPKPYTEWSNSEVAAWLGTKSSALKQVSTTAFVAERAGVG